MMTLVSFLCCNARVISSTSCSVSMMVFGRMRMSVLGNVKANQDLPTVIFLAGNEYAQFLSCSEGPSGRVIHTSLA